MRLHKFKIQGFRNYEELYYEAHEGLNLLVGKNGAGKTNFLDAIYFAALGRSYFTGLDRDVIRNGADFMRLEYDFQENEENSKIIFKWSRSQPKSVEINGRVLEKMSDYVGRIKVVMMAPQDVFVMQMGNTERRRWLNQFISQSDSEYAKALKQYNLILKRRNAYLKETPEHKIQDALLDTYWAQMMPFAEKIFQERGRILKLIEKNLQSAYTRISQEAESVGLQYSSILGQLNWSDIAQQYRRSEIVNGVTYSGIHKDTIEFSIDGKPLKYYGSQGQSKSFFIALKLAELEYFRSKGEFPIVLVDDVFAKLDAERIEHLFGILRDLRSSQVFVTDTDQDRLVSILKKMQASGKLTTIRNSHLYVHADEEE